MAKYSKSAGMKVAKAMHEKKQGRLKSGRSGKTVKSREQAIAIGLSEARKEGAKVPKKSTAKKTGVKKGGAKKGSGKKSAAKGGRRIASKKTLGGRSGSRSSKNSSSKKRAASAGTRTRKKTAKKAGKA